MRFEELNWFDVESYLKRDDRVMIVLGSCEQHGYLSLMSDARIPLAVADAASKQTGVLVAPAVNFGASPYFLRYPGTISLRIATLLDLTEDIVRSLYGYGFQKMLILNGHGGNDPVRGRLYELGNELRDLRIAWYAWWQSHSVESVLKSYDLKAYHAGWIEAFPFNQLGELPDVEKTPPVVPGLTNAVDTKIIFGDGVFGGKYKVNQSIMDEIFKEVVADVIRILQFDD